MFSSCACAFEVKPWLGEPYLFHFRPEFELGYYPSIEQPETSLDSSSTNERLGLGLGVATMSYLDLQIELDLYNSSAQNFNFQDIAFQVRKQFLDDVIGDPVSLTASLSYRIVPHWRLRKDPSVPYHYVSNFEGGVAVGKEIDCGKYWCYRWYFWGALGAANRGYLWSRLNACAAAQINNRHELALKLNSYVGFGGDRIIDVERFDGYYATKHRSIDLLLSYQYKLRIWGKLGVEGLYRLYAFSYPQYYRALILRYELPFSVI